MSIYGRSVSAVYQFAAFDVFPSSGNWMPLAAYQRSDGETKAEEDDPLLGVQGYNGRDPNETAPGLPTGGGPIEVPLCLRQFGYWLRAMLGDPVTTGSTPNYTHVFESGKDTIPYLAQSKKLKTALYRRTRGLIVNTMALTLEKAGGYPRVQLGVLHRDEVKATSEATGTVLSALALLRVPAAKPFAKFNGVAMTPTQFATNFSNQCEPDNQFNNSEYPVGYDPGNAQLGGSFTVRYTDATWDDLSDARTLSKFEFGYELNVNQSITFELPNARIAKAPLPITNPNRVFATYNVTPQQAADAPALKVTLKNDVAGYPVPPPPPPP